MAFQRTLIIGASGGIGSAIAKNVKSGEVVELSRKNSGFDLLDEQTIKDAARQFSGPFDLIVNATGVLETPESAPEKSIGSINKNTMRRLFEVNAIGPALVFKHFIPNLMRNEKSVLVTLSARVGSIEDNKLGGWVSYRASKAALNQIVKTASIELSRTHPEAICIALHPGTVATKLSVKYTRSATVKTPGASAAQLLDVISNLRPIDTGSFLDWKGETVSW